MYSFIVYSLCLVCRLVVAARFIRVLLFIRIVTGKDQVERATRRMVLSFQYWALFTHWQQKFSGVSDSPVFLSDISEQTQISEGWIWFGFDLCNRYVAWKELMCCDTSFCYSIFSWSFPFFRARYCYVLPFFREAQDIPQPHLSTLTKWYFINNNIIIIFTFLWLVTLVLFPIDACMPDVLNRN